MTFCKEVETVGDTAVFEENGKFFKMKIQGGLPNNKKGVISVCFQYGEWQAFASHGRITVLSCEEFIPEGQIKDAVYYSICRDIREDQERSGGPHRHISDLEIIRMAEEIRRRNRDLSFSRACLDARDDFHFFNIRRTDGEVESEAARYRSLASVTDGG